MIYHDNMTYNILTYNTIILHYIVSRNSRARRARDLSPADFIYTPILYYIYIYICIN